MYGFGGSLRAMNKSTEPAKIKHFVCYKKNISSLIQDLHSENNFANIRNIMKDLYSRKTEVVKFFESEVKKCCEKADFNRVTPWVDVSEKFKKLLEDVVKEENTKQYNKILFQRSAFEVEDEVEDDQVDQHPFSSGEYDSRIQDFIQDLKKCQPHSHKESVVYGEKKKELNEAYGEKKKELNGGYGEKKKELDQSIEEVIVSGIKYYKEYSNDFKGPNKKEFHVNLKNLGYAFLRSVEEKDSQKNQKNENNGSNRNDLKSNATSIQKSLLVLEKSNNLKLDISNIQKSLKAIVSGLEEERKKEKDFNQREKLSSFKEYIAQYLDDIGKEPVSNFNDRKILENYIVLGLHTIMNLKDFLDSSDLKHSVKNK